MRYLLATSFTFLLRPLLITGLCLLVTSGLYFHYQWHEGYWLIWAAAIFSLITFDHRLHHRLFIIACTGFVAATSAYLAHLAALSIWSLSIYLFVITFFCTFFSAFHPGVFLLCFFINFFSNISGGLHASLQDGLQRYGFLLAGIGIAIVIDVVCWCSLKNQFQVTLKKYYMALMQLSDVLFSCLCQQDYPSDTHKYERQIDKQKNAVFLLLAKLDKIAASIAAKQQRKVQSLQVQRRQEIVEIIIDIGRLRHQVSDYTVFAICIKELQAISQSLQQVGRCLMASISVEGALTELQKNIEIFESVYHSVLAVTAPEPMVFFLFIEKLHVLHDLLCQEVTSCLHTLNQKGS
ncbi:MAG: hypothetical protein A3E83_04200 [Gammaproteobacteria bacterium RIFCSPHIGHO2_12_FULL_41_20]|nr:MAG: hypothetical protein A3E83_04200 [Gammaproteobacteria bacterium RIFCSPHIGHO2_12_FULL_41_20]